MSKNKLEYRSTFTLDEEKRTISGYAAVFEKESNFLGFYETLKRGCITDELIQNSDVILNYQHDDDRILARSRNGEGTLHLEVRDEGLYFECEVPNTTLGNDIYESIKRGDLNECSFCFALDQEDNECQKWEKRDGVLYREISKIAALFDVAVVTHGAYSDTSVNARKRDLETASNEIEAEEQRAIEEQRQELHNKLNARLQDFLKNIEI